MDMHENASLTPKVERRWRERDRRRPVEGGCSAPVPRHAQDRRQVGRTFPHGRPGGLARPLVKAPFIAKPSDACRLRGGRGSAPAALHRRADRRRGRRFGGNCQPHPQTPGPQSPVGARAGRASPSLRTGHPGRDHPYRHQKAGQVSRIGHRVTGDRTGQSNTRGVGWEDVHLAIDDLPVWPARRSCRTKSAAPACVSCSTPCASFEASASGSSAS